MTSSDSIDSIDSIKTGEISSGPRFTANATTPSDELRRTRLAWMGELEASLLGSRTALLALDLAGIEQGTREQIGLIREFDALRRRPPGEAGELVLAVRALELELELEKELRRCGARILEAIRLQAALLARAQYKLRVLANMAAGPSVDYGPLLAHAGAEPRVGSRATLKIWREV
jgi:hypothetical protein